MTTTNVNNSRMAELAQAVAKLDGVQSELIPGPFAGTCLQLTFILPDGTAGSALVDLDAAPLFEVVIHRAGGDQLHDKLSLQGALDLLQSAARTPT